MAPLPGGSSRICTERLKPPAVTVTSTSMSADTSPVEKRMDAVLAPSVIVKVVGILASRLLAVVVTTSPPTEAALRSTTVAVVQSPPRSSRGRISKLSKTVSIVSDATALGTIVLNVVGAVGARSPRPQARAAASAHTRATCRRCWFFELMISVTAIQGPYYHPRPRAPDMAPSPRLQADIRAFLAATDQDTAERRLEDVLAGDLDRVVRAVIHRMIGGGVRSGGAEDAEDVHSDVMMALVRRLRQLRTEPDDAITDLQAYVATVTQHACYAHLRRHRPLWTRLRNQVRYVVTHDTSIRLRQVGDKRLYELTAPRGVAALDALDPGRLGVRDLVIHLLRESGVPLALEELLEQVAAIRGVSAAAPVVAAPEDLEQLADGKTAISAALEELEFLARLWDEIRLLPRQQRWALLLNLRDARGHAVLGLFPLTGVASIRQIAAVLEMPARELARLWRDLPLDDMDIAALLALTRQQVINLRKSARARLTRRTSAAATLGARGNNVPASASSLRRARIRAAP